MNNSEYKVDLPEGESNDWKVNRFEVTAEQAAIQRIRAMTHAGRGVPEGTYTRLMHNNYVVMSDTPDEIRDHRAMIQNARNNVLINGLGIGMVLQAVLNNPEVSHATVIELSEDVINLVGDHYIQRYGDRLTIINDDALTWKPLAGTRYGAVWHDIWDDITSDNLPEMHKLHRRYGRRADWQGSWCRSQCERCHKETW